MAGAVTSGTVIIEGLNEFRAALRAAEVQYPRQLVAVLKKAGAPVIARASSSMPHLTGRLAGSLSTKVRGTRADVVSSAPYGGGAEWGQRGKWAAWGRRYGGSPRFVWPAVEDSTEDIVQIMDAGLREIITAHGWFH